MAKIEKEIKILNIDVEETKTKLQKIGAVYKGENKQKIFVYDIPTIYYRFLEVCELLNSYNKLIINTNISKLNTILIEVEDLISEEDLKILLEEFEVKNLMDILYFEIPKLIEKLKSNKIDNVFRKFIINPNKWVRLRQNNNKIELTSKHVFEKENGNIQKVIETEINVNSLEETNKFLESIGLSKRSYQEKIRISYSFKDADIEIDMWPMLDPYVEIESENEEIFEEIINLLELNDKEIISCNTEQLYKRINVNIYEISELKF